MMKNITYIKLWPIMVDVSLFIITLVNPSNGCWCKKAIEMSVEMDAYCHKYMKYSSFSIKFLSSEPVVSLVVKPIFTLARRFCSCQRNLALGKEIFLLARRA